METKKQNVFDVFGKNVEHRLGDRKIIIGSMKWADWFHPSNDRIIFPATFTFKD